MRQDVPASRRDRRGFVRQRGGSYQVLVYAGPDPVTGKDGYVSGSTRDRREVDKIRTRLLAKIDQQRNTSTSTTLGHTIDDWLDVHDAEPNTIADYRSYAARVIKPALGDVPLANLSAHALERFYAQLRRCRSCCNGRPSTDHVIDGPHDCATVVHGRTGKHDCAEARCRRCEPHTCRPFGASTVRQIHHIISGALSAAVRWDQQTGRRGQEAATSSTTP